MNVYRQISSNKTKTWVIMILFVVFITTLGYIFGKIYEAGLIFAFVAFCISLVASIISFFSSSNAVLSLSNARQISEHDNPELFHLVENLCIADGMSLPKIYVMEDNAPNAFATGRDPKHGIICFTSGILTQLTRSELEGVTAHELSHIKNYDIRLMCVVAVLVGGVALLADFSLRGMFFGGGRKGNPVFLLIGIVLAALSPIIATLIQLSLSRKREFLADASGVLLTRYPEGLASALEKIASYDKPVSSATNATAHLFIENPFKLKSSKHLFSSLFNTHPPIEERIRILRSM